MLTKSEIKRLEKAHYCYWVEGRNFMTDVEFDRLIEQLKKEKPRHWLITAVGAPVTSDRKYIHSEKMLSLDKVYTFKELRLWVKKTARSVSERYLLQPKYDGMASKLENGMLSTRGDGETGELITDKLPIIEFFLDSPNQKASPDILSKKALGEIIIDQKSFDLVNESLKVNKKKPYKTLRNAVTGLLGSKELPKMPAHAKLIFMEYSREYSVEFTAGDLTSEWFEENKARIQSVFKHIAIDGLVIKLKYEAYAKSLGETSHHPIGAMAFKFQNESGSAPLADVVWQFGKGKLTPVAKLSVPVELGGVKIVSATLSNAAKVKEMKLWRGVPLLIERAGDVIPYVAGIDTGSIDESNLIEEHRFFIPPVDCPCCGVKLEDDGTEIRCANPTCSKTVLARLESAVVNIGIEGLGMPTLVKMANQFGILTLDAVFHLTREQALHLSGFAETSASNLIDAIDKAHDCWDWQILDALCIPLVGTTMSKRICQVQTIESLLEWSRSENEIHCTSIEGFGKERWSSLINGLRANTGLLRELTLHCGLRIKSSLRIADHSEPRPPTICFTGKMQEPRSYYEKEARLSGYEPVDSVTKELSLLVTAEADSNSSKAVKAKKLGVATMTLTEWHRTISEPEE